MAMFCARCQRQFAAKLAFCPEDGEVLRRSISYSAYKPRQTDRIGTVLGARYQIHGYVNQGATSRVYLAEDTETNEAVAVKMLGASAAQHREKKERFHREAEAARRIDHPNVVKIRDIGESASGSPYLVMEALLGETLGEFLRRDGAMAQDIALTLARQAAAGLAAAHAAGVVHRDVKPDNFFLLGQPGDPYGIKVLDFGMATLHKASTANGYVLGTIEYMAPEQIVSEKVDGRTDVYGLGVTMYRMFTGQLPFDIAQDIDLLAHQLFSPAPPPSWLEETLDPRVDKVILQAMRKSPDNRYPSMVALLRDLERILGLSQGEPQELPLAKTPDVYEPATERGREAAEMFRAKLGLAQANAR